jgi:hypothetical protein
MADTPIKKAVVTGVWAGYYATHKLPVELYRKTGKHLAKAVKTGYTGTVKFGAKDRVMVEALTDNTWFFSAAKTYQTVRGMEAAKNALAKVSTAFYDEDNEKISSFKAFRDGYYTEDGKFVEGASQIFDTFNEAWLKTEYDTAIAAAQGASRWQRVQETKEILPYLRFNGVGDGVECDICMSLDGICLPADDPFWDENWAGTIHWNCRCTVDQLGQEEGEANESEDSEVEAAISSSDEAGRQDMFKFNPGKDKVIFQTDGAGKHPYFSVAKGDSDLLKNNFNLPKV